MSLHKKAQVLEIKQGSTLALGCTARDAAGLPVDLTGIEIRSQVRAMDEEETLVVDLQTQMVNLALGTYELLWPGDGRVTAEPGDYNVDIQYTLEAGARDVVRPSRTFFLRVLKGVTR